MPELRSAPTAGLGFVTLIMAASLGCSKSSPRSCESLFANGYRVDYTMASKDCTSAAQIEPQSEIVISDNPDPLFRLTADAQTDARVNLKDCSAAQVQIDSLYKQSGLSLSVAGKTFDVHDDGSLHGPAELKVSRRDGMVQCSASIAVVLTPFVADAGAR